MFRPLAGGALILAVAACQSPAPSPPPAATTQVVAPAAERAREAAARSDWKAAAPLYREALATAAADVALHYGLAVAATHLDDPDEAKREFRWIVANASPDSQEYRLARAWLAEATGTTTGTASTSATGTTTSRSATTATVERSGDAGLYGRVIWASEPNGPPTTQRMQVHLYGVANTVTKDQRYTARTDEEGRYEFKRIVAGPYKLTNRVAGRPNWRVRVEVESGRDTAFDLHPGNSTNVRDDFPE